MDKKNDLLQTYRRREDEFRLPLKEGTWEKLEKELAGEGIVRPLVQSPVHRLSSRRVWIAAAAAVLCALLSLPCLLVDKGEERLAEKHLAPSTYPVEKDSLAGREEKEQPGMSGSCPDTVRPQSGSCPADVHIQRGQKQAARGKLPVIVPEDAELLAWEDETEGIWVEEVPLPENAPARHPKVGPEPEKRTTGLHDLLADARPVDGNERPGLPSGWAIGLQAGTNSMAMGWGGTADNWYYDTMEPTPVPPPFEDPENPNKPDKPDQPGNQPEDDSGTRAASGPATRSEKDEPRYHHRLPVSFTLSARKMLSRRIGLESGLTYTVLRSDISDDERGDVGEQSLHYIGVPVKLNWIFWKEGRFSAYLSAGAMAEYCFSATHYVYNLSKKMDMNRWDFSAGLSLGIQVELVKPVSLFAEPGVSYYFDTNRHRTDFESVRTEQPGTFTLQVGVRFSY